MVNSSITGLGYIFSVDELNSSILNAVQSSLKTDWVSMFAQLAVHQAALSTFIQVKFELFLASKYEWLP